MFVERLKQYWDYVCTEDVSFAELAICICSQSLAKAQEHLKEITDEDSVLDISKIGEIRRLFAEYVVDKDYLASIVDSLDGEVAVMFQCINGTTINVEYGNNFIDALPDKPRRSRCGFDYFFKDANDLARLLIILRQK